MDAILSPSPAPTEQLSFTFPAPSASENKPTTVEPARAQDCDELPNKPARARRRSPSPHEARTSSRTISRSTERNQSRVWPEDGAGVQFQTRLPADATMQDLLDLLAKDPDLPEMKRRNLVCSVRKFVEHLGLDLHMPAEFPVYREHLKRFRLSTARIGERRWANIKSDVAFALQRCGARKDRGRPSDLAPAWRSLRDSMPDERFRRGLSRLMHWCSRQGILPDAVSDDVMARFHSHLIDDTFEQKPDKNYRHSCKLWNDAADQIPGWPQTRVTLPSFRKIVSLSRDAFPQSFWDDFERYRRCRLGHDLTNNRRYDATARSSTINGHEQQLRRFASAMVRVGRPAHHIADLAALFDRPWLEKAIQSEHDRLDGPCPGLQESAATLLAIARNYLELPSERVDEIARIKRRLKCRTRGFTEKNRGRLRPFRDPRNQAAFLHFGDKLLKLATKTESPRKAALIVQTALMHEILLVAPMRMENLTALHIHRNFRFSGPGRKGKVTIVIQGDDVKNGVDLEFELTTPTTALLRRYLDRSRPALLKGEDDGWLFPGERRDLPKHQVSLSAQLSRALRRHTGLDVNPHLYHHIAAYFYLEAHQGDFETVRRLLGHRSLATTTLFYADMDRFMASRRYAEHILERRLIATPTTDKRAGASAGNGRAGLKGKTAKSSAVAERR